MTELIVVRHGQTDLNLEPRFQGQVDVPLNATGQAQAARLAQALAAEAPDLFVCSDLIRTRQTAEPLAAAWGRAPLLDAAWREQAFGLFDGHDFGTLQQRHPQLWRRWIEQRADFAPPDGGESRRDFSARVLAALRSLVQAHPGRRLLVVTHGGVLDMLWRAARALPLDGQRQCEIPNTGINRLRWADGGLRIDAWADTTHLETGSAPVAQ